jgi:phosphate transport system ATP-binding protein
VKEKTKIKISDLSFFYHDRLILDNVNAEFAENRITAIVGPSGQGKSTLLTILNRLWEEIPGSRMNGRVEIRFNGRFCDIHDYPADRLRRRVGIIFQAPNPLPLSIAKNMAFPLKLAGIKDRELTRHKVKTALQQAFLWDEVRDRLDDNALALSGGQQQRLCIARAMIMEPEVLLLDEPTSSLDSKACERIEQLMTNLAQQCTLVMVSHYLDQVKRVANTVWKLEDSTLTMW